MNPDTAYHGSNKWRAEWEDPVDVKQWLNRELFTGTVANICCGQNFHGDVRVDIDPENDPDVVADLHDLPFDDGQFDTVYVDPPFSLYAYQDGYWPREAWRVTGERLILNCPGKRVNLRRVGEKRWYVVEPKPGSSLMSIMQFQVFDRPDSLEVYT